ncbi:GNAT family N-acetyltransferase [Pinirhizobacter sp.]|jgi:CelD/BcsL family acetyltransferase involved in cellulose biosynthesis|uniref:GNAT family N-acetyltransferase n=1 Tax=Pinirhizobacter sp. TaxID=2950432 RepID=UPI002F40AC79
MIYTSDARLPRLVLDSVQELSTMQGELARLAEMPGAASSPVQHPDWLAYELASRGDRVRAHIVLARDDRGRLLGYAPFLVEDHHARIAFGDHRLKVYRGRVMRLLGSGVVAEPSARTAAEAAIATLLRADPSASVLRIQETTLPNTFVEALTGSRRGFTSVAANLLEQVNWTIAPQADAAGWLAVMDAKKRNDLSRRLRNVYKKLGDGARLRVFTTPAEMDEYCALMNQVYARSWHADAQAIDWNEAARRACFTTLAASGRVVGHMLLLGERPIAYVHGYRLGGRYLLDDTGYDEAFAALGVGSALVFQSVQDLMARHPGETIDFGYGDNQYKRVLATEQAECASLYLVRGPMARLRFALVGPMRVAYRTARRLRHK